jgi:hypothetical protein
MRASGPDDSGARLGRLSYWPLGSCEGLIEVTSHLGHDLLDGADPRLPAAFATGVALAGFGWGRGPDDDLVPGDLLVDEDGHSHLSVGDGRTYLLGKPVTKFPGRGSYVVGRDRLAPPGLGVGDGRNTSSAQRFLLGGAAMTEPRELSYLVPVDALAEVNTAVTVLGNLRSGGHRGAAAAGSGDHGGVEGREPGRGHRRRMAARQARDRDRPWLEAAYRLVASLDLPGQDIPQPD